MISMDKFSPFQHLWECRVPKHAGIMDPSRPAGIYIGDQASVVHDCLKDGWKEALPINVIQSKVWGGGAENGHVGTSNGSHIAQETPAAQSQKSTLMDSQTRASKAPAIAKLLHALHAWQVLFSTPHKTGWPCTRGCQDSPASRLPSGAISPWTWVRKWCPGAGVGCKLGAGVHEHSTRCSEILCPLLVIPGPEHKLLPPAQAYR